MDGRTLVGLCSAILGLPIREDDRFSEVGLHSLAAARLANDILKHCEARVSIREVLESTTPRELSRLIRSRGNDSATSEIERISRISLSTPSIPLSSSQEQIWYLEQLHPECAAYRFHVVIRFRGSLCVPGLEHALNHIVKKHGIFRTTFPARGGVPEQKIQPFEPFSLPQESLDHHADPEAELREKLSHWLQQPFSIEQGPLVRWKLFSLGEDRYALFHSEHHLTHDGCSFAEFLGELIKSYESYAEGSEFTSDELPVSFADYAAWQRTQLTNGTLAGQIDYWRSKLLPPPRPLDLSLRASRKVTNSFSGGNCGIASMNRSWRLSTTPAQGQGSLSTYGCWQLFNAYSTGTPENRTWRLDQERATALIPSWRD